ncbi:alpha/beta hydrolase [Nocardia caishijiensis]|uniref:S-formylglutathione hydrolase FrmB n=1 Tax=Nocardia caishijiensis TaxID=184756 RepID=A0ABQ6YT45_9NOCA|nr:alpha/beta hydrolase family protein [Nocardia caishijiensis]KAF0848970.1 S-formylglutathione hydrolase FrmB [Nocardia caishijiensis]
MSCRALGVRIVIAALAAMLATGTAAGQGISEPIERARIDDRRVEADATIDIGVYSPAMDSVNRVRVLRAADPSKPAPTLYLLNGVGGGADGNWLDRTDVVSFFRDKQVNVVIPFGGAGSYFADWRRDDPVLGKQRWTTFLTKELPPLVDAEFGGTGANAIAGLSMAGTSVFQLALAEPGLYRAIGSYSGCVRTSDLRGQAIVRTVVGSRMGNAANMWGPPTDPAWSAHDPYLHAESLRGTEVYISSGTGLPGPYDNPAVQPDPIQLAYQLAFGATLEAVTNQCTRQLRDRFLSLGIPATINLRPTGTHSWGYWQEDLHTSWPQFESALNR